ncbi:hypothetical protein D3C80_1126720 [compost metagenome]
MFGGAELLEQRGGGAGDVVGLVQRAGDQVGVVDRVDADRHVGAALDQPLGMVGQAQGDAQVRVAGAELGEQRGHHVLAEGGRRLDAQLALDAGGLLHDLGFGLLDLAQQLDAVLEVALAGVGQAQGAGVAAEQGDAQVGLQVAHAGGHRGVGDVQRFGGAVEAGALHHAGEHLHGPEFVDPALHVFLMPH